MSYDITENPLVGVESHPGSGHYAVYDHGAHVWAWQPDGQKPVLWMSAQSMYEAGQPIRGGVPVIFPWFGMGPKGQNKPAHGTARLQPWQRVDVEDTMSDDGHLTVEYETTSAKLGHNEAFPYSFRLGLRVTFTPKFAQIALKVTNTDTVAFTFEEALHTYIAVGDVRQVSVTGLEGADYLDRAAGAPKLECVQEGPISITAETDRLYMSDGAVVLTDPVWQRTIRFAKDGSRNTVVWNPWIAKSAAMADFGDDEWPHMICIEAANALDNAVTLPAGETHVMRQRITLV